MHLTKLSVRLLALAAAGFAVMLALSSVGPPREARADTTPYTDPQGVMCGYLHGLTLNAAPIPFSGTVLARVDTSGGSATLTAVAYTDPTGTLTMPDCKVLQEAMPAGAVAPKLLYETRPSLTGLIVADDKLSGTGCQQNFTFGGFPMDDWTRITLQLDLVKDVTEGNSGSSGSFIFENAFATEAECLLGGPATPGLGTIEVLFDVRYLDGPGGDPSTYDSNWDKDKFRDWDELDSSAVPDPVTRLGRDPFNPNDGDQNFTGAYNVLASPTEAIICAGGLPSPECDGQPDGTVIPGTYFHCIAAIDHDKVTNDLAAKMQCYTDSPGIDAAAGSAVPSRQDGVAGPPPPPPYTVAPVIDLNGAYDDVAGTLILDGCVKDTGGVLGPNIIIHAELDEENLIGFVDIHPVQTIADCDAKTPNQHPWNLPLKILGTPLELAELGDGFDHDGDGCTDYEELTQTGVNCGDDPYNPYDSDDSVGSISSMLVTPLRQDVDKVTGARIPGAYFHCISDTQHDLGTNDLDVKVMCYIDNPVLAVNAEESGVWPAPGCCGDGDPDSPPPAPYADIDDNHTDMTGVYDKGTKEIEIAGCFDDKDAQSSLGNVYTEMIVDANTGEGFVSIYPYQPPACAGSPIGTVDPTPMRLAEQASKGEGWDTDQDGCSDKQELGEVAAMGGLRDPFNRWDLYDVNDDQTVDLFNDIFGVAFKFGTGAPEVPPAGTYDYAEAFDRGGSLTGSNVWNQRPADGTIDLFNDIFGVAFQFGHTC